MALGHSLVQSNGPFLEAAEVDMIMLTYSDIKFSPASLRALESVGWIMRQVSSGEHPLRASWCTLNPTFYY